MMERRRFLNLASFGIVGATVPTVASAATEKINRSNPKDAPICEETLQLTSGTKPKPKKPVDNNKIMFYDNTYEEYKKVSMAVGRDGNLWLKTENGVWKRIVTE